ncbi:unannotated protein [freshwater metagenome]|uniref:Unannotated protein n=1 Tax=freshwater metagenome TaxID=449393 RepID=A0A6J7EJA9_9ZZZZ
MRDGNASGKGARECAADAGHDLDAHARIHARLHLLGSPTEHEGITALEPHDALAGQRPVDDDRVDLLLGHRVVLRALARVDQLHVEIEVVEQLERCQSVVHDDVRLANLLAPADGDEVSGTRPAPDEDDSAVARALRPYWQGADRELLGDRIADGHRSPRICPARHGDRDALHRGAGGSPGRGA